MNAASWPTAKRRYQKAVGIIDRAIEHLAASVPFDGPWEPEQAAEAAIRILGTAGDQLNADIDATRKALGIGIYQPYGRPARRRF